VSAPEFLDASELHQLTGYARPKGQAAWLRTEGIPHQVRGRRVIVSRTHSLAWLEGRATSAVSLQEPDLSCVT
jgi:hypothetical protein